MVSTAPDFSRLIPLGAHGHENETIPPGEAAAMAKISALIEAKVRAQAQTGPARRDAHPKGHGCVRAIFRVLDTVPGALKAGVLAKPATFQCWMRFSNGSDTPQADKAGDVRGMAIKLMDVAGSRCGSQDFILINSPVLFARNAVDYVDFITADPRWRFFVPGFNPFAWRFAEAWAAFRMARRKLANPLDALYFSVTPFALGSQVVKYSARPLGPPSAFSNTGGRDFLHDNLVAHLAQGRAEFEFSVQVRGKPADMPVEDVVVEWDEAEAPFTPVARITIEAQGFDDPARRAFCENLSFSPWQGLDAHCPLGGINRVRRVVYETVSALRHGLNGAERREPEG